MDASADVSREIEAATAVLRGKTAVLRGHEDVAEYDAFLSYNWRDKDAVRAIARQLRERGLRPWMDERQLRPGAPWQPELEEIITRVPAAAVFGRRTPTLARMARKVPLGTSWLEWTGTATARPSEWRMKQWLPLIRTTVNPAPSSALMTFAPGTAGILLGTSQQITRDQATLSVNVISSGIPTSSMRSSKLARRSTSADSLVGPSPNAATPGRSWAEAHQTPSSSCSTT
jgi:hypothetical protein